MTPQQILDSGLDELLLGRTPSLGLDEHLHEIVIRTYFTLVSPPLVSRLPADFSMSTAVVSKCIEEKESQHDHIDIFPSNSTSLLNKMTSVM